jgi:two-component system chemotaxis response regulator CheB
LFRSLAEVYGNASLCVILTGMGHDGREGARAVAAAGGSIIVQDQPTSVVWGMPGAVAEAGLASAVLPLAEIAPALITLTHGKRS